MLLSGCSNPIEYRTKVITVLPPVGLVTPCYKPKITGTTPAETAAEDVPRLKAALSNCAAQATDYIEWRQAELKLQKENKSWNSNK
ncbi:Rz1-like lysis system protein LysC [Photobacterium damselae]|uniref:Rz1-like lysis system protein LysC n=1 Tax=Photobacterium damselae TaxID=38293 RepID=UPI001EFDD166|nr:hypothetical protein [Photobacterium damselae]MCG9778732.1 hypothetical protein [Photobacterium damselae]